MKKIFFSAVFATFLFILIQIICSSLGIILQGNMLKSDPSLFLLYPIIGDILFGIGMFLYLVQTATFRGQQGRISRPVSAILSGRL